MSDGAIVSIVSGVVTVATIASTFFTLWIKLRYGVTQAEEAVAKTKIVENKVDNNTRITEAGTIAAAENARTAAAVAMDARATASETKALVERKLNGGLDETVRAIAKLQTYADKINDDLQSHMQRYEARHIELLKKVDDLLKKVS